MNKARRIWTISLLLAVCAGLVAAQGRPETKTTTIDRAPLRMIKDPYPSFSAVAVDPDSNMLMVTDENLFQVLEYDRRDNTPPSARLTEPKRVIWGTNTHAEMMCGVYIDPVTKEVYVLNNDTQNWLPVFSKDARGNANPSRYLAAPHGTFGIAVDEERQEMYLTVQHQNSVVVYRKQSVGDEKPLRTIRGGPANVLALNIGNPGAVGYDTKRDQILVPNWVAHPQIAAFARLANGGQAPARTVYGQTSKLSRTMHDIRYDEIHDEFLVVNPFAEAILTFRGATAGQEAPIRIIQGPHAQIGGSRLDVDPVHNEIFVPGGNRIRVYPRDANGDVAPIRVIEGPDTQLANAESLAVDPINNVLVVGFNKQGNDPDGSILIFNRTDSGNVKPKAVIHGPKSGIIRINQIAVYPPRKLIVAAMPGLVDLMEPPNAFLGVWSYDDNGDAAPRFKIPVSPKTTLKKPFGVVLNPKNKEVVISDMRMNGVLTFSVPEIF